MQRKKASGREKECLQELNGYGVKKNVTYFMMPNECLYIFLVRIRTACIDESFFTHKKLTYGMNDG